LNQNKSNLAETILDLPTFKTFWHWSTL